MPAMTDTRIGYMHRDGCNYKTDATEVLDGATTDRPRRLIDDALVLGDQFLPDQVGLAALHENWSSKTPMTTPGTSSPSSPSPTRRSP